MKPSNIPSELVAGLSPRMLAAIVADLRAAGKPATAFEDRLTRAVGPAEADRLAFSAGGLLAPAGGPEGDVPWSVWIRAIRARSGLSQSRFASALAPGFSVRALQAWEAGRDVPRLWVRWLIAHRLGGDVPL